MIADYLERGVLAGAIAGCCYGAYVALVANPFVGYVEGIAHHAEHGHDHAHAQGHEPIVGEAVTAIVSAGSGVLWGIFLGGLFGLAFYFVEPALPGRGRAKAYVLAAAGFLTVSGTPWLVVPPTMPGAEHAVGTQTRLAIYAGLMVLGALLSAASIVAYRRVAERTGNRPVGLVVAAVPLVATVAIVSVAAPPIVLTGDLPAELVAAFRGLALLSQVALWALLAGSFGWLHDRADARSRAARDRFEAEASTGA